MTSHIPVLLNELMAALKPKDGEVYLDGTFGAGGMTRAMLQAAACRVVAMDRDANTAVFAAPLQQEYGTRFAYVVQNFSQMCAVLEAQGLPQVDAVVLDLGVSSMQLDDAERGFSFKADGPLDMRMGGAGVSAADVVNRAEESELARILYHYGEERASRRIARAIVEARAIAPITRTGQLQRVVAGVVPGGGKKDPATRTFQALRIEVNQELRAVEDGLRAAESVLAPGGRLLVISFHSLEDRLVKQFFQQRAGKQSGRSRHLPPHAVVPPSFSLLSKCTASAAEIASNPRSRSATLRFGVRSDAPAWRVAA